MTLLRIEAPHFVAGIIPKYQAAPILMWMIGKRWNMVQIVDYCAMKNWRIVDLDQIKPEHYDPHHDDDEEEDF